VNYVDQEVALETEADFGENVPISISSALLRRLDETARPCIRMAIEGASAVAGASPAWLERASDIRTVGFSGRGSQSVLHLKAPPLGEAIPEFFEQQTFWPRVASPEETVIQLIGRVSQSVRKNESASDIYDQLLLKRLTHWQSLFKGEVGGVRLPSFFGADSAFVTLDSAVIENARKLNAQTPLPRQIRIVGRLDMVRYSTRSFGLVLERGDEVRGVLQEGDSALLQRYFGREITVFGKAIYRPSGSLLRIDAQEILDTTEGRQAFSSIPEALVRFHRNERKHQIPRNGVSAFFASWPGEETDEELLAALGELRN
jgi:hypothetical protein